MGLAVVMKVKDFDFSLITEVLLEVESLWLSERVEFGEEKLVVLPFGVVDGVWGDFIDFCDFLSWEVEFHDAFLLFDHQYDSLAIDSNRVKYFPLMNGVVNDIHFD